MGLWGGGVEGMWGGGGGGASGRVLPSKYSVDNACEPVWPSGKALDW